MKKLTRKAAWAALAITAILVAGASTARASDEIVLTNLKVPFAFMVGDVRLPAGDYTVREASLGEDVLEIVSADGHHFALASTIPGTPANLDRTEMVFRKFGHDHFLARVALPERDEREIILTPHIMEREVAKAARANN